MKTSKEILQCAQDLIADLRNLPDDRGKTWTATNFAKLENFVERRGQDLKSYYNRGKGEDREFLWDFIASSPETGIFLAAESEQKSHNAPAIGELKHDFEKLLYVYAPIRILITKARDREHAEEIVQTLRAYAKGCTLRFNPGSVFVLHFGCWDKKESFSYVFQSAGEPDDRREEMSFAPVVIP